jgi:hypothetical protein
MSGEQLEFVAWLDVSRRPVMVVMEVIVRLQDRGALRLDHLHNRHPGYPYNRSRAAVAEVQLPARAVRAGRPGLSGWPRVGGGSSAAAPGR